MRIALTAFASALLAASTAAETLEVLPSGHPVARVSIDGSAARRFVIDTAASTTTILPALRAQMPDLVGKAGGAPLNGASGTVEIETVAVDRIEVDGCSFEDVELLLLPPGPVDKLGVDGILGADLIADFAVEIDIPARQWRLAAAADAAMLEGLSQGVPFVLDAQRAPRLTIRLNGIEVPAVLDTGARGTIINWAAARAIGLSPDSAGLTKASDVKGASAHATPSMQARLAELAIGESLITGPNVRIADLPVFKVVGFAADQPAVILGIDMFADRRFVIDHPGLRLHVSEAKAAPPAT
ncbi:aspartyl protease family protein [Allosphingosinicella deserti]|nr:aspartyl protease family protein [Sphingomonas deserti]